MHSDEVISGNQVREALVAGKNDGVSVTVSPSPEMSGPSLAGRLVAAVPGYALVVVGTFRGSEEPDLRRGAMCELNCTIRSQPYEFQSSILDVRRMTLAESITWAIRTTFPSTMRVVQRRARSRVKMDHIECPVYLREYGGAPSGVRGRVVDVSPSGLLAHFAESEEGGVPFLSVGRAGRVVFQLPESEALTEAHLAKLDGYVSAAPIGHGPRTETPEPGVAIFDLPARVMRLDSRTRTGESAGFRFEDLTPQAEQMLTTYVDAHT